MQTTNWGYEGMWVLKVKVISLPYIFQVLYVLCFTRPRYQVSVLHDHWSSGYLREPKVRESAVRVLYLRPNLPGGTSVRGSLSPITPTRCYPVALGLKLQESVSNFGSRAKFHVLIEKVPNFGNPQFESSIYAKLAVENQCAWQGVPYKAY